MTEHWEERLREVVAGRRFVVATDVLVAASHFAGQLRELGVEETLCLSAARGVGAVDPQDEERAILLGTRGSDLMGAIRAWIDVLHDLPDEAHDAIDTFDPGGRALVVQSLFGESQRIAGRPVFGARPPAWVALEDKTLVDAIWDASGVARAPSRVVPVFDGALREAAAELDEGRGTVWVADNRLGWHGGAQYLRWVRGPDGVGDAIRFFDATAHRVRVMPFLDGIPCSIHGMVFDDHIAAFRPCEMVVLRRSDSPSLHYAGPASSWEPAQEDREDMRAIARRVGAHLDRTVGYRGVFTVDGVMTSDGFRPTELNPRYGAAIDVLARGADLPLYLLHLAVIERPDLDWRPHDLEEHVLAAADGNPVAQGGMLVDVEVDGDVELALVDRDGELVPADGAEPDVLLQLGPSTTGAYLRVVLPHHPAGAPAAPGVVRALSAAATHLDLDIPPLEAAVDRRVPGAA